MTARVLTLPPRVTLSSVATENHDLRMMLRLALAENAALRERCRRLEAEREVNRGHDGGEHGND